MASPIGEEKYKLPDKIVVKLERKDLNVLKNYFSLILKYHEV